MNSRLAKQILFGAGYLIVLFLIVFTIYFIWLKPGPTCFDNKKNQGETEIDCDGPCKPCEIKTLKPLEISLIKYFPSSNKTAVVAEIKNSNTDWGADYFDYFIEFYDKDNNKIKTIKNKSFIYASEIKNLFELAEFDSKIIAEAKISFENLNWKPKEKFEKPIIQLREIKMENVVLSGFLKNSNAYKLAKIKILGFLYDQYGILITVSKTELENLPAFEERLFKINFPKDINIAGVDFNKTKIYVETIR